MRRNHTFAGDTLPLIVAVVLALVFGSILIGTVVTSCQGDAPSKQQAPKAK